MAHRRLSDASDQKYPECQRMEASVEVDIPIIDVNDIIISSVRYVPENNNECTSSMSQLDCIDSIYCSWKNGNCVSGPRLKNILSLSSEGGDLIDIEGFNFGIEALGSS